MAYKKNGNWVADVVVEGIRRQKKFPAGTPRAVVENFERRLKLKSIDPSFRITDVPAFEAFAHTWLEEVCRVEKSFSTYLKCKQLVRTHLAPKFGGTKLHAVQSIDVVTFQRELLGQAYAVQSINNVLACLSSIFKEAIARGIVSQNPVAGLKRLKRVSKDVVIWTIEEKERFLTTVKDDNFEMFQVCLFALTTGLRPMELRGLLRGDIDFEIGEVRVCRQWCTKQNKLVPYTKTRESRTVPVPREVLTVLANKRQLASKDQVFPQVTNSFGHRYLKPYMQKAGVRVLRLHDFRHTFASHMLMLGADLMQVKELLGHRKLESTMIYLHAIPGRSKGATDRLMRGLSWVTDDGTPRAKVLPLSS